MTTRKRLPDTRESVTRTLRIKHADDNGKPAETDVYVHVGLYEDGTPGEVFLRCSRMGSTVSGLLDVLAVSISLGLQHGVPLSAYTSKLINTRFEPAGPTNVETIKIATSLVDAIARWLDHRFPPKENP